jgi:hypothetical protein
MTSGTAVSVSPTTTTIYKLTVTPTTGSPISETVSVTVDPAAVITSFSATPATITAGETANLTGIFTNGTGVITGGASPITVTSGTAVAVTPTTTTKYTLTVTNANNTAVTSTTTVTVATGVTVDLSSPGPAVTDQLLGMNLAAWFDDASTTNAPMIESAFKDAGIKAVRWPGGSWGDDYNWETNT